MYFSKEQSGLSDMLKLSFLWKYCEALGVKMTLDLKENESSGYSILNAKARCWELGY